MGTVYIFRTNQRYKEEDLIKEREKLIKQIKDGFVLLNVDMEFVSALTEPTILEAVTWQESLANNSTIANSGANAERRTRS